MRRSRNLNLTNSSLYSFFLKYPDLNKLKFQENEAIHKFDVNNFREITILGSSQFVVKQYEYVPRENFPIAIKIIPLPKSDNDKQKNLLKLFREIENLKELAHPNIIKLYGVCLHKNEAWICMELMDMTLEELYLQAYQYYDIFPEKELGCIAVKVIDALKYCKYNKIIHRDLKPQNILLNKTGDIKLCDFGESRVLENSLAKTLVGTVAYWPPERFKNKGDDSNYDIRADIWSLGITLVEVVYGKLPYKALNESINGINVQYLIMNIIGNDLINQCCQNKCSSDLCSFFKACLSKVEERPRSYDELQKLQFYELHKELKSIKHFLNDLQEKENLTNEQTNQAVEQQPVLENLDKITFPDEPDKVIEFSETLFERDFEEEETIGIGRFVVKSYFYKPLKKKIAIKFIYIPHNRYDNEKDRRMVELIREITILQNLAYAPNVVNCYGVCIYARQALICMELMDMSLRQVFEQIHQMKNSSTTDQENIMKTLTQSDMDTSTSTASPMEVETAPDAANMSIYEFPEEFLAHIAVALLNALVDCKKQNVIHRNIKPEKVLLNRNGEVKLYDFGEAGILHDSLASTFAGTCYWPPERFEPERKKYDIRADIWSLGMTLVEIVQGSAPIKDRRGKIPNNIILLQNLILSLDTKKLVEETFSKSSFSDETREFVQLCLNRIETRPKYEGLRETKFYKRYGSVENEERKKIVEKWIQFYGL